MNERIKELAEQAKLNPVLLLQHWGTNDALTDSEQESLERIEKFAKLIVRECAEFIQNKATSVIKQAEKYAEDEDEMISAKSKAWLLLVVAQEMQNHFGVNDASPTTSA